jgi:hypothetical protein
VESKRGDLPPNTHAQPSARGVGWEFCAFRRSINLSYIIWTAYLNTFLLSKLYRYRYDRNQPRFIKQPEEVCSLHVFCTVNSAGVMSDPTSKIKRRGVLYDRKNSTFSLLPVVKLTGRYRYFFRYKFDATFYTKQVHNKTTN